MDPLTLALIAGVVSLLAGGVSAYSQIRQGQQAEQGLAQAEQEGLSWRERLALKRAAGQLGSQN